LNVGVEMHEIHERDVEELYNHLRKMGSRIDDYFSNIDPNADLNHDLLRKIKAVFKNNPAVSIDNFDDFFTKLYEVDCEDYLVGFLDILGFKSMLINHKFGLIMRAFEKITDSIYTRRRNSYLNGTHVIEPKITNFSDSIIVYSKLFNNDSEQDNKLIFGEFSLVVRDIVAELLKLGVPIRGAVSIGPFYAGKASSYTLKSTSRYGAQHGFHSLVTMRHSENVEPYDEWQKRILPSVEFPVHFGEALTSAYMLESRIESIGIFMQESVLENKLLSEAINWAITLGKISKININEDSLLAYNWCKRISYDDYLKVEENIINQVKNTEGRIRKKWKSLEDSLKYFPKR
jgi:hypothetical protein